MRDSPNPMKSPIIKRSVVIAGHKTGVSLEDDFWNVLNEIAEQRGTSVNDVIASINAERRMGSLSSALRLFALTHVQNQIPAHPRSLDAAHPAQTPPSQT